MRFLQLVGPIKRSKCLAYMGIKVPPELKADVEQEAAMITAAQRMKDPQAPEKTASDFIRDCIEFKLTINRGLRLGYYSIRTLFGESGEVSGETSEQKVKPENKRVG